MAISPFSAAINQLADERGLPRDVITIAIELAVAAAYRKEYGMPEDNLESKLDEETGQFEIWQVFDVVEEVESERTQLTLGEAKKIDKKATLEGQVRVKLEPQTDFGRIAAQTAKQVVNQKLREAEREVLFNEYKEKENQLINGYVQRIDGPNVILNIGKLNGIMIASDQIPNQHYYPGQRLKILVYDVEDTPRGPRVMVTRSSADFIRKLFELEVPEIASSTVEIKLIAREAGTRTKMAVISNQPGLDPVGSCVGQRGTRVQAVLSELGEEKIDIISWSEDTEKLISNALSPAKIREIVMNKKNQTVLVKVDDDQLPLAIGKNGQNVRLASKLTGWEININKELERKSSDKLTPEPADSKEARPAVATEDEGPVELTEEPAAKPVKKSTVKVAKAKITKATKKTVKKSTEK